MYEINMSRKAFEDWVRALHSGIYPQSFKAKMCILGPGGEWQYDPMGVFAEVHGLFTHEEQTVLGVCKVVFDNTKNTYRSGFLPEEIMPKELQAEIMGLCDRPPRGEGKSFAVVGAWIEGNVKPRDEAA